MITLLISRVSIFFIFLIHDVVPYIFYKNLNYYFLDKTVAF